MKQREKQLSVLRAAIPLVRGIAEHVETGKSVNAATQYNGSKKSYVVKVFTPEEPLKRVHELLHAKYSKNRERWPDVNEVVKQIIEDVKLHLQHWPWPNEFDTPQVVLDSIQRVGTSEHEDMLNARKDQKGPETLMQRAERLLFSIRMLSLPKGRRVIPALSEPEHTVLYQVLDYCKKKSKWKQGAILLDEFLFGSGGSNPTDKKTKSGKPTRAKVDKENMAIIDLPKIADTSTRSTVDNITAPSGRILNYREIVRGRKLMRPNRVFFREVEEEHKGGTVLIDASGSMGITQNKLAEFCRSLPAATIAYYCGTGFANGALYIYAKDGKRAGDCPRIGRSNCVDNAAMTWLLAQQGPKFYITDGGFCGAGELSATAIARFSGNILKGEFVHLPSLETAQAVFSAIQ